MKAGDLYAHASGGWDRPSPHPPYAGILSIALEVKTCLWSFCLHQLCDLGQVTYPSIPDGDNCSYPTGLLGGVMEASRERAGFKVKATQRVAVPFY